MEECIEQADTHARISKNIENFVVICLICQAKKAVAIKKGHCLINTSDSIKGFILEWLHYYNHKVLELSHDQNDCNLQVWMCIQEHYDERCDKPSQHELHLVCSPSSFVNSHIFIKVTNSLPYILFIQSLKVLQNYNETI